MYGQNSPFILQRFAQSPWSERLARPTMRGVVRLDRPFDDPFPPDVRDLDQVWIILFYHDTVWMQVDRAKMNRAVFDALRPGGVYAVVDHSGRPGTGATETQTLHRIEERVVTRGDRARRLRARRRVVDPAQSRRRARLERVAAGRPGSAAGRAIGSCCAS